MADSIFEQLSSIQSLLSDIKLFSTDTASYKENDHKKYYKLTCSVQFNTYYKYVAVNNEHELKLEIEKFGDEIAEEDLRKIQSSEVTVKDCLQDFIDNYEKKIQKWYFHSSWDASQGRNRKMDEMFDEIRNSPVFHTYSALKKWEQFEAYCQELLNLCEKIALPISEYKAYLTRLEKAADMEKEYQYICDEIEAVHNKQEKQEFYLIKPRASRKKPTSTCSYEINEEKLKFLFWEVECSPCGGIGGLPNEIACILTDTKLNILDRWQYTKNKNTTQELKAKLEALLKDNYLIFYGWSADFMCIKHFLSPGVYMTCDLGNLYAQVVGKRLGLEKMSEIVLEDCEFESDSSITDANQALSVFKKLCNLRGESPCDMIRFFQMKLSDK